MFYNIQIKVKVYKFEHRPSTSTLVQLKLYFTILILNVG